MLAGLLSAMSGGVPEILHSGGSGRTLLRLQGGPGLKVLATPPRREV